MAKAPKAKTPAGKVADSYIHQTDTSPMRPEIGTQANFRKKKAPRTYRYDSSLSPALEWDGAAGRELGEWLIGVIERASVLPAPHAFAKPEEFKDAGGATVLAVSSLHEAVDALKRLGKPFLNWAGKAERLSFDVPTLPLFVHERLTEGWDCNTVTHIVGLRPFMSQLLCEQVVGRGLRRRTYELADNGLMTEEVSKVFGVPFQVIPFKATTTGHPKAPQKRHHVHAVPARAHFEIQFPRVEGYRQAIRNRVSVDWSAVPPLWLDPAKIPPEVQVKASLPTNTGRPSLSGPGRLESVDLNPYRSGRRVQELVFELAKDLTREYVKSSSCEAAAHVLFPQLVRIVQKYVDEKVTPIPPAERVDLFLSPYYGWAIERLVESIRPDTSQGEAPEVPRYETSRGPGLNR